MALINDPDNLSQGASTAATDAVFSGKSGSTITITSAGSELPLVSAGDYFVVRNHPLSQNNGLYFETGGSPAVTSITALKISGAAPDNDAVGIDIVVLGNTTTPLNIFYDTAAKEVYLLEQNGLGADGVLGQTVYSKMMIDWKDDSFLIANAPIPMLTIDADAGKFIIGQDASGNNSGWNWEDNVSQSIRTRKLLRNMGWTELDSSGNILASWFGCVTLGAFEDPTNDTAYYQFGTNTTINDTIDFDFNGPVNEAVQFYERLADGSILGGSGVAISTDGRTMTRSDGGNWSTDGADGFKVGGQISLRNSENTTNDGIFLLSVVGQGIDGVVTVGTAADTVTGFDFVDGGGGDDSITRADGGSWITEGYFVGGNVTVANATTIANDGTYVITTISASAVGVATASLTADTTDTAATFGPLDPTGTPDITVDAAIDNGNAVTLRLRIRDGDTNGKTFAQANLGNAGETILGNRLFKFPLANATDLKISATDGDIASAPYNGMSITFHPTAQSVGADLDGGPFNFGIVVECNSGTSQQVYEFIQYSLRQTTDIDADAGADAIGRTIDGMVRFVGDNLEAGSADGGLSFPVNPDGGGSGVYLDNLAAGSKNTTTMYDNANAIQSYPIGTPVTLDFNQTLIDDTIASYTLFFDHTIQNSVADLIVTAGTAAVGTLDSTGANFPATLDSGVGAYVRVAGLTGVDAAMNGIYQVTALTSTSQWDVLRVDNTTIVTTSSAAATLDEHPIDSPDAIIVKSDVPADVTGLANSDFSFTFDYSGNNQGGRTVSTDAEVKAKAVGQSSAQYTESSVQTIQSATAKTIPLVSQQERNFSNP